MKYIKICLPLFILILAPIISFSDDIYWFDLFGFKTGIGTPSGTIPIISGFTACKFGYINKSTRLGFGLAMAESNFRDDINGMHYGQSIVTPFYLYYLLNNDSYEIIDAGSDDSKTTSKRIYPIYLYFGGGYDPGPGTPPLCPNSRILELGIVKSYSNYLDVRLGFLSFSVDSYDSYGIHNDAVKYEGIQLTADLHLGRKWGVGKYSASPDSIVIQLKNEKIDIPDTNFYISEVSDLRGKKEIGLRERGVLLKKVPILLGESLTKTLSEYFCYSLPVSTDKIPICVNILKFNVGLNRLNGGTEIEMNFYVKKNNMAGSIYTAHSSIKGKYRFIFTKKQLINFHEENIRTALNQCLAEFSAHNWNMQDLLFRDENTYKKDLITDFVSGKYEKAGELEQYNIGILNNPGNACLYANRAWFFYRHEDYERALRDIEKGFEVNTDTNVAVSLYSIRACVFTGMKKHEEALKDLNKAIELDPNQPVSYENINYVYKKMGQKKDAEAALKKGEEILGYKKFYGIRTNTIAGDTLKKGEYSWGLGAAVGGGIPYRLGLSDNFTLYTNITGIFITQRIGLRYKLLNDPVVSIDAFNNNYQNKAGWYDFSYNLSQPILLNFGYFGAINAHSEWGTSVNDDYVNIDISPGQSYSYDIGFYTYLTPKTCLSIYGTKYENAFVGTLICEYRLMSSARKAGYVRLYADQADKILLGIFFRIGGNY